MEVNRGLKYRIKWFRNIVGNGLFLFGLRNRMASIGIDIDPMYWVLEGQGEIIPPKIRENASEYKIEFLDRSDVKGVADKLVGPMQRSLIEDFESGKRCIGLRHGNEIAAIMFIEFKEFHYKNKTIKLLPNEAYLLNMYTFEAYRGNNLAPYLRYHSYQMLRDMGIDTIYSQSAFFNRSSLKFKKKLNAKNQKLYLFVELFKKFQWTYLLRTYK